MAADDWPTFQDGLAPEPPSDDDLSQVDSLHAAWDEGDTHRGAGEPWTLADYELHCCIGRGGTCRVFRATRRSDPRTAYAVKIYTLAIDNEESRLRFGREVQALTELDHPHIAALVDHGITEQGHPFAVLQYIDGLRLDEYCIREELTLEQRIRLLLPICDALQFAHDRGILHRDLKPGNILVDRDGRPYLTDFGLSKPQRGGSTDTLHTGTGAVMGTLNYMAPEQLFVGSAPVTTRTDIFGLGAVMYTLLTDQPPMRFVDFIDAAKWYYHRLPTSLKHQGNLRVPRQLEAVCLKCLSANAERRYRTVRAFQLELQRFLDGDSVSARGFSVVRRISLLAQQYPWLIRSTAALLVALALLVAVFFGLWQRSEASRQRADRSAAALKRAMRELSRHVRQQGQSPETIHERRTQLQIISRSFDDVAADFDNDAELLFSAAQTDFMLGRIECYLGNQIAGRRWYTRAASKFQRLVDRYPDHEDGRFGLYHALNSLTRYKEAADVIEALVRDYPDNLDYIDAACTTLFLRGRTLIKKGREAEGWAIIDRAIALVPQLEPHVDRYPRFRRKIAEARSFEAQRLAKQGRLEQAQEHLEAALQQYRDFGVLNSPVAGETLEFDLLLAQAITIAARRGSAEDVERYRREAEQLYEQAQQRYTGYVATYWGHAAVLKSYLEYLRCTGDAARASQVQKEVQALSQLAQSLEK